MPQGRILLKAISESRKLAALKTDGARLLYSWLIPHVDVNGCFSGDPEVINGQIFTRLKKSVVTVESYLDDLEANGLIMRYQAKGDIFLHLPTFVERQPHLQPGKEGKATIPRPTPELLQSYSRVTLTQTSECDSDVKNAVCENETESAGESNNDCQENQRLDDENATPELLQSKSGVTPTQVKQSKVKQSKVKREGSEKDAEPPPTPKAKKRFGEFVLLFQEEHDKLVARLGEPETKSYIERLDHYIGSRGRKYKSHYHTILNWVQKDADNGKTTNGHGTQRKAFERDFGRQHSEIGSTIDV